MGEAETVTLLLQIVVCPAGFRDIGVGDSSRYDSIDNTDYVYQQKVGIEHTTPGAISARPKITRIQLGKAAFSWNPRKISYVLLRDWEPPWKS